MKKGVKKEDKVQTTPPPQPPTPPAKKVFKINVLPSGLVERFDLQTINQFLSGTSMKSLKQQLNQHFQNNLNLKKLFENSQINLLVIFAQEIINFATSCLFSHSELLFIVNIFLDVLLLNNHRFPQGSKKNKQSDRQHLQKMLIQYSVNQPIFSQQQIWQIANFYQNYYEGNYQLFYFSLDDPFKVESQVQNIFVDIPIPVPPLAQALSMGRKRIQIQLPLFKTGVNPSNLSRINPGALTQTQQLQLVSRRIFGSNINNNFSSGMTSSTNQMHVRIMAGYDFFMWQINRITGFRDHQHFKYEETNEYSHNKKKQSVQARKRLEEARKATQAAAAALSTGGGKK